MKTKAKYVIVILFLCTIPLYFCRMIGWKDDAIRLYDVILYTFSHLLIPLSLTSTP